MAGIVIDLCNDSSDSEGEDSRLSHISLLGTGERYLTPEKKQKCLEGRLVTADGPKELAEKKNEKKSPKKQLVWDDSDSSIDDELLNFDSGLTRKTRENPPLKTAANLRTQTIITAEPPKNNNNLKLNYESKPKAEKTLQPSSLFSSEEEEEEVVTNPYAKRGLTSATISSTHCDNLPTLSSCSSPLQEEEVQYPVISTCSSQQHYDDLRAKYILAFWKYSQSLVHASYNLGKLDQYCKRINILALSKFPVRSLAEYCQRVSRNADAQILQEALRVGGVSSYSTPPRCDGRYVSIAEACLISLLSHVHTITRKKLCVLGEDELEQYLDQMGDEELQKILKEKNCWVFLEHLLPMIDNRLQTICPGRLVRQNCEDNGASYYTDPSTRSAEFRQIEKLQSNAFGEDLPYIKLHRQKGEVCYELTVLGYKTALRIRRRTFPETFSPYYRTSNLTRVEPRFNGVCLAVDRREGGGETMRLHSMCNKLDTLKIPYLVCTLNIGDYCFFDSKNNKLLPILVERKSIQDIAASIYDGRWSSQKRRMFQGQYVFGYNNCHMAYIVEGGKEAQQLTGGYVGQRHYNVTREQLDREIEKLESEGFDVLRTKSPDHSMVELARWATRVSQDFQDNKLTAQFTFEEFKMQIRNIPHGTDFSRIAKDMVKSRLSAESGKFKPTRSNDKKPSLGRTRLVMGKPKAEDDQFKGWTVAKLQKQCVEWGLPKSGKKADLIARLNGPRPPQLWLDRKKSGVGYVPSRHDTCANAILVAILLEQKKEEPSWKGMTKDEIYPLAERLCISKDPFSGTGTGRFKYDGWSSMTDLKSGEIPLVILKRGHYKLTTSSVVSGLPFAEAMHKWCHEHNCCSCQEAGYEYNT